MIGLILLILFVLFANIVVKTITGSVAHQVLEIYYILIFTLITIPFGPLFTQILIIQKRYKEFNKVVISTFIFNLIISPISIYYFQGVGLAVTVILTHLFVINLCLVHVKIGWLK